jgi:hypothetical protein
MKSTPSLILSFIQTPKQASLPHLFSHPLSLSVSVRRSLLLLIGSGSGSVDLCDVLKRTPQLDEVEILLDGPQRSGEVQEGESRIDATDQRP